RARRGVSFRTEMEGVTITKTYTLVEGEYHVGLQVDLERPRAAPGAKPSAKEPIRFRYQLTGAKGLPVEGKWYTGTFRNALIALEDDNGPLDRRTVDRRLQELRQIGVWMGGNAVNREDGKLLRYAGRAVQYFASVIVVDDEQDDQRFLRRATPTLETAVILAKAKHGGLGDADSITLVSDDGKVQTTIYIPQDARELRARLAFLKPGERI